MQPFPAHADDLDATLDEAFRLLRRGVVDRKSPFRTLNVATVGADGVPSVRTVVLRGFDPAARLIRFHTDRRSAKVSEIQHQPRVALHAYDRGTQVQLRLSGTAAIHSGDAAAEAAWARSAPGARACYAIQPAPGTPVSAPVPAPAIEDEEQARAQFVLVEVVFDTLEWLWLSSAGHRRARFDWRGDVPAATWLVQ
ncbi:pyridoxamine 5'-phosphate oxidase family protein [Sphingomonas sp. FW199]